MSKLPDCQTLAGLVSNVTRTMCDVTFVPGDAMERGESIYLQMVMIPLRGDPNVIVVVASDTRGSRALGAAFFGKKPTEVTQQMVDDAIAELLNMVAAQISNALGSKHQLGLPSRTTLPEIAAGRGLRPRRRRADAQRGRDRSRPVDPREHPPSGDKKTEAGGFRSLLRKMSR